MADASGPDEASCGAVQSTAEKPFEELPSRRGGVRGGCAGRKRGSATACGRRRPPGSTPERAGFNNVDVDVANRLVGTFGPRYGPTSRGGLSTVNIDRAGFEVLDRDEALALLAGGGLGRIGISSRALPMVLPVHYAVDNNRIVIRTYEGSTLSEATRNAVVAFEAEGPLEQSSPSWSVHVNGVANHVADDLQLGHHSNTALRRWSQDRQPHMVSISLDRVSGRRLVDSD